MFFLLFINIMMGLFFWYQAVWTGYLKMGPRMVQNIWRILSKLFIFCYFTSHKPGFSYSAIKDIYYVIMDLRSHIRKCINKLKTTNCLKSIIMQMFFRIKLQTTFTVAFIPKIFIIWSSFLWVVACKSCDLPTTLDFRLLTNHNQELIISRENIPMKWKIKKIPRYLSYMHTYDPVAILNKKKCKPILMTWENYYVFI